MDYRYTFEGLRKTPTRVHVVSRPARTSFTAQVSVDDSQFLYRRHSAMSPLLADLIDIGTAVHVADRASTMKRQEWVQRIHVDLPLRCREVFTAASVYEPLRDALHFFSGDNWSFDFLQREELGRHAEMQMTIEYPSHAVEVSLWSGGLDSLAGLYNRMIADKETEHTIFGAGANLYIQKVQRDVASAMQGEFPGRIKLEQVPFQFVKAKRLSLNKSPRLRGFIFLLFGAVCACLEGQDMLFIYENGVGAINLPFRRSAIGLDHSRAVYPISLCYMADLLTAVLGTPFRFHNPFLFWTKAQMCEALVRDNKIHLINTTITCDRRPHDEIVQCGKCSSCLLRRQALAFLGVQEQVYHISRARSEGKALKSEDGMYLRAMYDQIDTLRICLANDNPWDCLAREYQNLPTIVRWFASREGIPSQVLRDQLVQLYRNYVDEWHADVCETLGRDLLQAEEMHRLSW
jgi:hypothetical protein